MYMICYWRVSRNSHKINVINFVCCILETNNMLYCIYGLLYFLILYFIYLKIQYSKSSKITFIN